MATIAKSSGATSPPKKGAVGAAKPVTTKPAIAKTAEKVKPVSRAATRKAPTTATPAPTKSRSARKAEVHPDQRRYYIEVAAYYIAERRGFMGGSEAEDWTAAEVEIDQMLRNGKLNG